MAQCCSGKSTFVAPNLPCNTASLPSPCFDLLNAAVQIIIGQRNAEGLTTVEIWTELASICPDLAVEFDINDLADGLQFGVRRGVLCLTYRPSDAAEAYLVNGKMTLLNPLNNQYTRCVCEFYSSGYTRPSRPRDHPDCVSCATNVRVESECDPCVENSY